MENYGSMIMVILMIAMLYFLMIRPENKRKKQAEEMRNSLKKGDQITTIGGIMGRIVMVKDNSVVIETSEDRVRMEVTKWAVSTNNSQQPESKKAKKSKKYDPSADEMAEKTGTHWFILTRNDVDWNLLKPKYLQ